MSKQLMKIAGIRKSLPVRAACRAMKFGVSTTFRVSALFFGFLLMMMGVFFSMTVIGAIIGVPCIIAGGILFAKGLF